MSERGNLIAVTESGNQNSERPREQRVEEWLNRAGHTTGMFASLAGVRLARIGVFVREEFEDMWAETQAIRRSQRDGQPSDTAQAFNKAAGTVGGAVSKAAENAGGAAKSAGETAKSASAGESTQSVHFTDSAHKWTEKMSVDFQGAVNKAAGTVGGAIFSVKKGAEKASSAARSAAQTVGEHAASQEATETSSREESAGTSSQVTEDAAGVIHPKTENKAEQVAQPEKETIKATESARKLAEKLGVDLGAVKGSGVSGQITVEDVRKNSREGKESSSNPPANYSGSHNS